MSEPPAIIDGARVVKWAWSGVTPFFVMPSNDENFSIHIFGLAICQYENSGQVYKFFCNENWEAENDLDFGYGRAAIEEAMAAPSAQYDVSRITWQECDI